MTRPAVVSIPVYQPAPSALEAFSLARCAAVLGRHPFVFFGPASLDFGAYLALAPGGRVLHFDDRYFGSLGGYSELLIRPHFYEAFADFEYLLIYQLDAFVFEDHLEEWCAKGYDYLGAPWLGDDGRWTGVGNGGFSLRRVRSCLDVLHCQRKLTPREFWEHVRKTTPSPLIRALKYHRKLLMYLGIGTCLPAFLRKWVRRQEPEDMFWGLHAARYHPPFRVAPVEEAIAFAVEAGLELTHARFEKRPPFGCHRNWLLEGLYRFAEGQPGPRDERERLVWGLARVAGMARGGDK
jgi:hypothetical protein